MEFFLTLISEPLITATLVSIILAAPNSRRIPDVLDT